MEGGAVISADVYATYARDSAMRVEGVTRLVGGSRSVSGVRARVAADSLKVTVRIAVERGRDATGVAERVQEAVASYLVAMSDGPAPTVDVVVADIDASE